jgi:23S rRNA pseudouridine1911/1915/1917 synthase
MDFPVEDLKELIVEESESDTRLDVFLSRHLPITRSEAARMIDQGRVLVDGKPRKPSFRLQEGMKVSAETGRKDIEPSLAPADIPLSIIYEDSSIIVIDKPAGLVVHPGAGTREPTLVNALVYLFPEISNVGDPERPGIVHRLDKLTSGVMVVARTQEACRKLAADFKAHKQVRIYKAICYGRFEQPSGRIETLMHRSPRDRKKMSSKVAAGRSAVTNWLVLKEWRGFSLLELSLETGRTHQIRVHLSDMGHPVAGDPEYGGKRRANTIADPVVRSYVRSLGRQMLHACRLGIIHPVSGEWMEFSSALPEDFRNLMALLDERQQETC